MNLMVTGGSGLLGKNLVSFFSKEHSVIPVYYKNIIEKPNSIKLDITSKKDAQNTIKKFKPDVIIHTASERRINYCEQNPEISELINFVGTKNITDMCSLYKIKLIFVSSDMVFDGQKNSYNEEDLPKPLSVYGKQKFEAEKYIVNNLDNYIILRSSTIYGSGGQRENFVSWALNEVKSKNRLEIFQDQFITPIFTGHFAIIIDRLLKSKSYGLFHVGEECISKFDFVLKLVTALNLKSNCLYPITLSDKEYGNKRPNSSCLSLGKIKKEIDYDKITLANGIENFIN